MFKVNQKELTCTGSTWLAAPDTAWQYLQDAQLLGPDPEHSAGQHQASGCTTFSPHHCCLLLWFVRGVCPTWVMYGAHSGLVLLEHRNSQDITLLPAPEDPCALVSAWGYISGLLERLLRDSYLSIGEIAEHFTVLCM